MLLTACKKQKEEQTIYVGTYTDGDSKGVYRFTLDLEEGTLSDQKMVAELEAPSFLKIAPNGTNLYAVQEINTYNGSNGAVQAFEINKDFTLTALNNISSEGAHPCYLDISKDGKKLSVTNYSGGNIMISDIAADGTLREANQVLDHNMEDAVPVSPKVAHAHASQFLGNELYVADLGLEKVKRYKLKNNLYVADTQKELVSPEGTGPRHFSFTDNGLFLYVINENNSTISVYKKNGENYESVESISTLASGFKGKSYCADIHVSNDGKYVYGSNRGENTIVIFKRDLTTGKLTVVGREKVRGDWPRNFGISPADDFLIVANQKSNNMVVFKRDKKTGLLTFTQDVNLPSPVCIAFLKH